MTTVARPRLAPIVVGVSPSTGSPHALRWAAEEATYRQAPLHAVMAWRLPSTQGAPAARPPAFLPRSPDELQAEADARLARAVEAALGPDHRVQCAARRGTPAKVLAAAGSGASLLVLEARPAKGSTASGFIAAQVVHRVPCPVVMVPSDRKGPRTLGRLLGGRRLTPTRGATT